MKINRKNKRRIRNNKILVIIYFIVVPPLIFIGTELWIPVENCECYYKFYHSYFIPISVFFFLLLFSYILYRTTKSVTFLILAFFIPVSFIIFNHRISKYLIDKRTENNLSIVKRGVIEDKYCFKIGCRLAIFYYENTNKYERTFSAENYNIDKLSVGDTILFVYVEKCEYIAKIYKYEPTKAELDKCKNDCYLINGKLIPISEYKKSKNKELY